MAYSVNQLKPVVIVLVTGLDPDGLGCLLTVAAKLVEPSLASLLLCQVLLGADKSRIGGCAPLILNTIIITDGSVSFILFFGIHILLSVFEWTVSWKCSYVDLQTCIIDKHLLSTLINNRI